MSRLSKGLAVAVFCSMGGAGAVSLLSQTTPSPVVGKSLRYVNPLNIEAQSKDGAPLGVSLGDPTVVRDGNRYYLFATGGGPWVSDDMVIWRYSPLSATGARVPVAPEVEKYNGMFYMSGNASPLYRSANILGPYEEVGPWLDEKGEPVAKSQGRVFDVDIFVDSDNKPYVYMSYGPNKGIWGAPMDPNQPNKLTAAPKTLFAFNPVDHPWESSGDANERTYFSYLEGPLVFKRNGTYYMQYSASGTEWRSYATGIYKASNPLGPYRAQPAPLLRKVTGLITGPGHGSSVQAPDGQWWQYYLTVMPNPPGGRRIGMDPIGFDANGNMFIKDGVPSETPQWAPGVVRDAARNGDSGSRPLTIGKIRNLVVSSARPGRDAAYALDNWNGTWWEPAEGDAQPTLTVDLLQIAPFDQPYTVDSSRIEFRARGGVGGARGAGPAAGPGGAAPAQGGGGNLPLAAQPPFSGSPAFRYKLETSLDGKTFTQLVDKTSSTIIRYTEFDEFQPAQSRFVRLTFTDWPRADQQPLGVMSFTVFGKYIDSQKP
jgi:hypothetical protein